MSFFAQPRWQWVKDEWAAGNYSQAILTLMNGFPNMVYPGGEVAYDAMCADYEAKYGSADNLKAWKNVLWREMFHFLGGVSLGLLNLPFIIWAPTWTTFIIPLIVQSAFLYKEIFLDGFKDRGFLMPKDFLDAAMWGLGAFLFLLL